MDTRNNSGDSTLGAPTLDKIFNLEFRPGSNTIEIEGYRFSRVDDYRNAVQKLQHLGSVGSEFHILRNTGSHSHTANLTMPTDEAPAILEWEDPTKATALDDILLLLTLFTGRDVFRVLAEDDPRDLVIRHDPRFFPWGGILVVSVPYIAATDDRIHFGGDIGLEVELPQIYSRMKSDEWRRTYKGGYFLLLLNQAIRQTTIESAFIQCWTIWEHLFACLTDPWMSKNSIQTISSKEKIAYLLVHFGVRVRLDESHKNRLDDLAKIRNRLIHYGRFPEGKKIKDDAAMFVRMTEFISAKALGLYPSNIFNTIENLEKYLTRKNDQKELQKTKTNQRKPK